MQKRIAGLDVLKILAVFFVFILHTNGYSNTNDRVLPAYYLLEGFAYCAIHIFVIIGSYILIKSDRVKFNNIIRIYVTTLAVTISGLVISFFVLPEYISINGILKCLFPISARAYWYVSDYVIFLIISPLLLKLYHKLNNRGLVFITIFSYVLNRVLPTLFDYGEEMKLAYLPLFITLFFVAGCFVRNVFIGKLKPFVYFLIFIIITLFVGIFPAMIGWLSGKFPILNSYTDYLFNYNRLTVIIQSACVFGLLYNIKIDNEKIKDVIGRFASVSLLAYLLHMHPIVKQIYEPLNVLGFIGNDSPILYGVEIIGVSLLLTLIVSLIGMALNKLIIPLVRLSFSLIERLKKRITN